MWRCRPAFFCISSELNGQHDGDHDRANSVFRDCPGSRFSLDRGTDGARSCCDGLCPKPRGWSSGDHCDRGNGIDFAADFPAGGPFRAGNCWCRADSEVCSGGIFRLCDSSLAWICQSEVFSVGWPEIAGTVRTYRQRNQPQGAGPRFGRGSRARTGHKRVSADAAAGRLGPLFFHSSPTSPWRAA